MLYCNETESKYKIVNTCRHKDSIVLRIVRDERPREYSKAEEPNLKQGFSLAF